uniref:Uncharacterized protein n=1 Tax=Molossus molossus TaxID=27622 RepID=A0A7J8B937_MOLMO|nr:hypothetical protein HJG59_010475 [Molossus molossus]
MEARDPFNVPALHPSQSRPASITVGQTPASCPGAAPCHGPNRALFLLLRTEGEHCRESLSDKLSKPHPAQGPLQTSSLRSTLMSCSLTAELSSLHSVFSVAELLLSRAGGKNMFTVNERGEGGC